MHVATIRHCEAPAHGRTLMGLASAGFLLLSAVAADASIARVRVEREREIQSGPLELSVRIGSKTTPLYQKVTAQDRWYLEAKEGARYEIRVRNTSHERVAFVMSVDGLNVINGERTTLRAHEPMYVLDPYGETTIKGWRRSLETVNRFVFVDEERSYAERMGKGNRDLGWIRVATFREERPVAIYRDDEQDSRSSRGTRPEGKTAPEATRDRSTGPMAGEMEHPGTGWGREENDRVRRVHFDPEPYACATAVLRYEYKQGLVALGILPWRGNSPDRLWERENGQYGFAVPPPGSR